MLVKVFLLLAASLVVGSNLGPLESDKDALNEFYKATSKNGPWKSQSGWGTTTPVCSWFGISCGDYHVNGTVFKRVVGIKLDQNNLQGSLPDTFFHLEALTTLILSQNNIEGEFPNSGLSRLTKLDLSYNAFSGKMVSRLDLNYIDVSNNYFEGTYEVLPNTDLKYWK